MKNRKQTVKHITFLLALVTVVGTAAACKGSGKKGTGTTEGNVTGDVTTQEAGTDSYPSYLKDRKYDGADFRYLSPTESYWEFAGDEENREDILEDAIYRRNAAIMENHDVKIEYIDGGDVNMLNDRVLNEVQTATGSFDAYSSSFWYNTGNEGVALNLKELETFDFSNPWWYQGWNDSLTYQDGSMYYCTGAVNLLDYNSLSVVFFNYDLIKDVTGGTKTPEILYQMVRDKQWTSDNAFALAKLYGSDVDSNRVMDENDEYGAVVCTGVVGNILPSWGVRLTYKDKGDGTYEYNFLNKTFVAKYEKYYSMLHDEHITTTEGWEAWPINNFAAGHGLFIYAPMNCYSMLRDSVADYGILPLPLYDEKQKEYITRGYGAILDAIPVTCDDPERSAVILEAMNYESYVREIPVFQEKVMMYKAASDDNAREMLNLIYRTVDVDFVMVHGEQLKVGSILNCKSPNIASAYKSSETVYNNLLNALINQED